MATCILVRDLNGNPAPSVSVSVNYAGKSLSAISDIKGIARFSEDIPDGTLVVHPQNVKVSRVPCLEQPPTPSVPAPSGEREMGRVGTTCSLREFYLDGHRFVKVVHDNGTQITHGFDGTKEPFRLGDADPRCHEKPQPTVGEWMDGITKSLAGFQEGISKAVDDVRNAHNALGQTFDEFRASMYDWLVSRVLDAILQSLDDGVKKYGR